jgi:hypothetical protein
MIDLLETMRILTKRYEHLAEIRIHAKTDTNQYDVQVKVHPHAKGTINKIFRVRPDVTREEFLDQLKATCVQIDRMCEELGAEFNTPYSPHGE